MPAFHYRVARTDGTTLEGLAEGETEQAVRAQLEGQGFLIFQLRRSGSWLASVDIHVWSRRTVPLQEFLVFNQEFLALMKAGLPILRVWDLLIERTKRPAFQATLRAVRQDVRGGASMGEALAHHPIHFPDLYVASVRAGELSGNLPDVLQRYIAYLKLIIGLHQKMMKALAYPAFLVIVGVAVIAFLLTYVMPTFSLVYGDAAMTLPPATRGMLALIATVREHIVLVMAVVGALVIGIRQWLRTQTGRAAWDKTILAIPLVSEVLINHHTIQFARTLATVLTAGTTLVNALPIVRGAVSNKFLSAGLVTVTERVREGGTLAAALAEAHILPKLSLEMIAIGEETGSLETMLRDIAELYEGDLDQRLNQLTTWIEPVLLLMMGVVVGAIVIIMYLPVFQMAGTIK